MNQKSWLILHIFNSKLSFQSICNETISVRSAVMEKVFFNIHIMGYFVDLAYKIANCIIKIRFCVFLTVNSVSQQILLDGRT